MNTYINPKIPKNTTNNRLKTQKMQPMQPMQQISVISVLNSDNNTQFLRDMVHEFMKIPVSNKYDDILFNSIEYVKENIDDTPPDNIELNDYLILVNKKIFHIVVGIIQKRLNEEKKFEQFDEVQPPVDIKYDLDLPRPSYVSKTSNQSSNPADENKIDRENEIEDRIQQLKKERLNIDKEFEMNNPSAKKTDSVNNIEVLPVQVSMQLPPVTDTVLNTSDIKIPYKNSNGLNYVPYDYDKLKNKTIQSTQTSQTLIQSHIQPQQTQTIQSQNQSQQIKSQPLNKNVSMPISVSKRVIGSSSIPPPPAPPLKTSSKTSTKTLQPPSSPKQPSTQELYEDTSTLLFNNFSNNIKQKDINQKDINQPQILSQPPSQSIQQPVQQQTQSSTKLKKRCLIYDTINRDFNKYPANNEAYEISLFGLETIYIQSITITVPFSKSLILEPYLLLVIPEVEGNYLSNIDVVNKSFCKLIIDNSTFNNNFINLHSENAIFDKIAIQQKNITLEIFDKNGNLFYFGQDRININSHEITENYIYDRFDEITNEPIFKKTVNIPFVDNNVETNSLNESDILYFYYNSIESNDIQFFEKELYIFDIKFDVDNKKTLIKIYNKNNEVNIQSIIYNNNNKKKSEKKSCYIIIKSKKNEIFHLKIDTFVDNNVICFYTVAFEEFLKTSKLNHIKIGYLFSDMKTYNTSNPSSLFYSNGHSIHSIENNTICLDLLYKDVVDEIQDMNEIFFIQKKQQITYTMNILQ